MQTPLPNRLAVYLTAGAALLLGLAPAVADFDAASTAGIIAGLGTILGVVATWLYNWGKYERGEGQGLLAGDIEDEFDEEMALPPPDEVVKAAHTPESTALKETARKPTKPTRPNQYGDG